MTNPTIGSYLKDLRLRKGYSIERISAETKISLSILKKLENNELTAIPNITYVKGYVQNILKTLHVPFGRNEIDLIDKTYIGLGLMKDETPVQAEKPNPAPTPQTSKPHFSNQPNTTQGNIYNIESLKSKRIVLVIVSIFVLLGVFRFIQKINQQPDLRQTQVKSGPIVKPAVVDATASTTVAVVANTTAQVTPMPTPSVTATPVASPSPTAIVTGIYPQFEFKKITNLAVTVNTTSAENTDVTVYTEEDRKKITPGKENVFVTKLEGESWISYKKNEDAPRSVLLKAGQKFLITGDKLFLTIGNTLGLKIFHNGQLVQFVDTKGVKSFIFPLADANQHSLPLFVRDAKDKLYFYQDYIPLMNQESNAASATSTPAQ